MRPQGEIRQAILRAGADLCTRDRGFTVAEVMPCVPAARERVWQTVDNMARSGDLVQVGERVVDYRNRPVKEYKPADMVAAEQAQCPQVVDLNALGWVWARPLSVSLDEGQGA